MGTDDLFHGYQEVLKGVGGLGDRLISHTSMLNAYGMAGCLWLLRNIHDL